MLEARMEKKRRPYVGYSPLENTLKTVYISAAIGTYLGDTVELYEGRGVLAFKNQEDGQIHTQKRRGQAAKYVTDRTLCDYLALRFIDQPTRRLEAWYDRRADAVLFGAPDRVGTAFDASFQRLSLGSITRLEYRLEDKKLFINRRFQGRSRVVSCGSALAFVKVGNGPVVCEKNDTAGYIQDTAVVRFCETHWKGARLYRKTVGHAVVLSPELERLARIEDLKGFQPLGVSGEATLSLERTYTLGVSAAAREMLTGRASVYMCGGWFALQPDRKGDLELQTTEEGGGRVFCNRLYRQLSLRFPGKEKLHLLPYGPFLIISDRVALDKLLPPPQYFCRLLVRDQPTAPLMRSKTRHQPAAEAALG